ncbi:hypothetical protein [Streptomyces sp. NPDC021020]|uniref:hypothetical protein n=1 Tax=Streptomyces sp. NPDC021020 TaxID=3365109 RepID=UPI0037984A46
MGEWGTALIAAGSAVAGSIVTGWYARIAGGEQARAARHAGDRQADATLEAVRLTLREQAAERALDVRRQAYVRLLDAAGSASAEERGGGAAAPGSRAELQQALAAVELEGPADVSAAAAALAEALRRRKPPAEVEAARQSFLAAARAALRP